MFLVYVIVSKDNAIICFLQSLRSLMNDFLCMYIVFFAFFVKCAYNIIPGKVSSLTRSSKISQ